MKVWRMVECSCDGGYIGKTWKDTFFASEELARKALMKLVNARNEVESNRACFASDKDKGYRLYFEDSVEEIHGWVNWAYTSMLYIEPVEVHTL